MANQTVIGKRIGGLQNWLDEVGARKINEISGPGTSALSFYAVAGTVMIVQTWATQDGGGFEFFIPPTRSNRTDETFVAARRALEVK